MFPVSRRLTMFTFSVLSIIAIASIPALATQVVKHDSKVTVPKRHRHFTEGSSHQRTPACSSAR